MNAQVLLGAAAKWLFPPCCAVCGEILPPDSRGMFCEGCSGLLVPISGPACPKCGRPIESEPEAEPKTEPETEELCGDCIGTDFAFERSAAIYPYDGAARSLIHRFKYMGHQEYARFLGGAMARRLEQDDARPDAVIPVPMFWHKQLVRGFNQSELLAREIAARLGLRLVTGALLRVRNTTPQSRLSAAERRQNVLGAFKMDKKADLSQIKSALLIDDIFTTGSTLNACAGLLREHGVKSVCCCTACVQQADKKPAHDIKSHN